MKSQVATKKKRKPQVSVAAMLVRILAEGPAVRQEVAAMALAKARVILDHGERSTQKRRHLCGISQDMTRPCRKRTAKQGLMSLARLMRKQKVHTGRPVHAKILPNLIRLLSRRRLLPRKNLGRQSLTRNSAIVNKMSVPATLHRNARRSQR